MDEIDLPAFVKETLRYKDETIYCPLCFMTLEDDFLTEFHCASLKVYKCINCNQFEYSFDKMNKTYSYYEETKHFLNYCLDKLNVFIEFDVNKEEVNVYSVSKIGIKQDHKFTLEGLPELKTLLEKNETYDLFK